MKSHRDALREHLGPKTFNKLIGTVTRATAVVSVISLNFWFFTLRTLPTSTSTSYLHTVLYAPFIRWWYLRLWLGISFWNLAATALLNRAFTKMALPLIFAAYTPSQLPACIQDTTNNTNTSTNTAEDTEQGGVDDPSDAFWKSAPLANGSKYSYSSLLKLLQWQNHDLKHAPSMYIILLGISSVATQLCMLSFATGGGFLWLAAVVFSAAMDELNLKKENISHPNMVSISTIMRRGLPLIGAVRIHVRLLWNIASRGYWKYMCPLFLDNKDDKVFCVDNAPIGPFYTKTDVELVFRVLLREYSFLGVVLVTSVLLFLSFALSKVKAKHLPRWWWAVCPKRDVVAACSMLAEYVVQTAWMPATKWVTTYTVEFLAVYSYLLYDNSMINIPYSKPQNDYGAYPAANLLLAFLLYKTLKLVCYYLVWRPWLPLNLLALVLSTSSILQNTLSASTSTPIQPVLCGGLKRARLAKLLPLTVYLLGGKLNSTLAVFLPPVCLYFYMEFKAKYGSSMSIDDQLRIEPNFSSAVSFIIFSSSVVQFFKLTRPEIDIPMSLIGFLILFFTPLGTYVEDFVNNIPMPSMDALLFKLSGGRLGGGGGAPSGKSEHQKGTASSSSADPSAADFIPPMMKALPIPKGTSPMVASILAATNHYAVLGMTSPKTTTDEELRKAKRTLSLATHPDKVGDAPGAFAALQRVNEAADVLLDTEKRKVYDKEISYMRIACQGAATELEEELADIIFEKTGVDITQKDFIMVSCGCALKAHQAPLVPDRTADAARYCQEHKTRHAVSDKESWIEKEFAWNGWLPGSILRFYTCYNGKVYDCSVAAECGGLLQVWARSGMEANTHENYYTAVTTAAGVHPESKSGGGGKGGGGAGGGSGKSGKSSGPSNSQRKSNKKKNRR